jgi:hypothetical protein
MAGIRIRDLPTATSPNSSDVFPIVNNNLTKQVSFFNAATSLGVIFNTTPNYIIIPVTDNAVTNGTNLLSAYTTATTLTPNASARSSTNRAVVFLPPATYNLGSSTLLLNTSGVDIVGLTRDQNHVTITSSNTTATISQTANDVRCIGFTINNTVSAPGWVPSNNLSLTYWENVTFSSISANNISGTFKNCKSTNVLSDHGGFIRQGGIASGTFIDCIGINSGNNGGGFVGYGGTASGTFTNCTGTSRDFGGGFVGLGGTASGTFNNCTGSNNSGGGGGFVGYGGTASGTFIDCVGTNKGISGGGFVGSNGAASGTFINCTGSTVSMFGGGFVGSFSTTVSGIFINCSGSNTGTEDSGGFAGRGGSVSGTFINCNGSNTSISGGGFAPKQSFGSSFRGAFINCISTDVTLPVLTNSGIASKPACYINCLDSSGNLVNGSA